ncbi:MAG: phosphatase PAP2 family protein [Halovenus sp.]
MALLDVLTQVTTIVGLSLVISLVMIVGLDRLPRTRQQLVTRVRIVFPYLVFLGVALGISSVVRSIGPDISWIIDIQLSPYILKFEGDFVAWLQTFQTPVATKYFSAIYVYGYGYLLVFPIIAYALAERLKPLRLLVLAYILNYVIGLVFYIVFVSYGPRNYSIGEGLLYAFWPQAKFLTSEVNVNTNVFPSLHTSLSVTVAILAVMTRDIYRRWVPIAIPLAISVCISTMYLGIHWAADVIAGTFLAVVSVYGGLRLDGYFERGVAASRVRWGAFVQRAKEWWQSYKQGTESST